eukprot:TRINITY_DN4778_c0_g1_i2.p1 TRINITY_DN4778_c0_g1~~TRINITY_DN4778_c0_g1_i2.p1  ORF type:complete len:173 (-),score=62.09 TRINITY_DN4778_c0_g1_i2:90-608(-)
MDKKNNSTSQLTVLLICGLPGSGKSTISKQLEGHGWIRINQDDLGTQDECKKLLEKALKHDKSVVLDRVNVHSKERKMWLNLSKKYTSHFEVLFLNLPKEVCVLRAQQRKNHPTLGEENAEEVIDSFLKGFSIPEAWEGPYEKVMVANTPEEVKAFVTQLCGYPINQKKLKY